MQLTNGAVDALTEGAKSDCLDINAIIGVGDYQNYYACQYIWEEERFKHLRQPFPEYQPVLEVKQINWLGTQRGTPVIRMVVTDGFRSMEMRPSLRSDYVRRRNFKNTGHLFRGKLNVGKRFTLLEYTTDVIQCAISSNMIPTIFYEDLRAAPEKKNMKSLNRDNAKQRNLKDNKMGPKVQPRKFTVDVVEIENSPVTFEQAVQEMECQLQRLKMHRSRLGY